MPEKPQTIWNQRLHKIWYASPYAVRIYAIHGGGYWWGIHPAGLLFPKDHEYVDEGGADTEKEAWIDGIEALTRWSQAESH